MLSCVSAKGVGGEVVLASSGSRRGDLVSTPGRGRRPFGGIPLSTTTEATWEFDKRNSGTPIRASPAIPSSSLHDSHNPMSLLRFFPSEN